MNSLMDLFAEDEAAEERAREAQALIEQIDSYPYTNWCKPTVDGIDVVIRKGGKASEAQIQALQNILDKLEGREDI